MDTYRILEKDGSFTDREPTVGKWYCGMVADESYAERGINNGFRDEALAEYIGDGDFCDERNEYGEWPSVDMGGYDYLAEQCQ